jgi:nucleotide-binding universal stress UspA family protein
MMPFRNILFPVDFSDAAFVMVPLVMEIARRFEANVTVLHAFNLVTEYNLAPNTGNLRGFEPPAIAYTAALQGLRDSRKRRLEEFVRTQFPDVRHLALIEDGDPALVIEWAARRENADLTIMPTRGLGRFRRLLVGSVTAKVLHDLGCPVLTSAHEPDPTSTEPSGFRSILCAVNLSAQPDSVLRTAGFLAQTYGARICLLHIEPASGVNGVPSTPQEILQIYERAVKTDGPRAGVKPAVRIIDATIPEGIRQTAIEEAADLMVVGRGHMQGILSQAWSHLYTIIRESPCPVLSV